jgi:hypothetical protein
MHFTLPENLKSQILAYDPAMKALAAAQVSQAKKEGKPNKFKRFGVPDNLFPAFIATPEEQKATAVAINNCQESNGWSKVHPEKKAILAYYNNVWTAVWEDDEHGIGVTYLSKGTGGKFVNDILRQYFSNDDSIWQVTTEHEVTYSSNPRMKWNKACCTLTKEQRIEAALGDSYRNMSYAYRHECKTHLPSVQSLLSVNTHRIYRQRMTANGASRASGINFSGKGRINGLGLGGNKLLEVAPFSVLMFLANSVNTECYYPLHSMEPIAATLQKGCEGGFYKGRLTLKGFNWFCSSIVPEFSKYEDVTYTDRIIKKTDTPTIRRYQQEAVDQINACLFDSNNEVLAEPIQRAVSTGVYILMIAQFFDTFYPNASVDHIHQVAGRVINNKKRKFIMRDVHAINKNVFPEAMNWLTSNAPIQTVLGMLIPEEYNGESININIDSIRIIERLLNTEEYQEELKPPRRWRDLHDYVMSKEWKIKTPNELLPQDLFPEPVKDGQWTFFQPRDVHQLADWGRAVRNCVGGTHYAQGIKKKNHFIVLAMVNRVPMVTIQLSVQNGVMNVDQISKVSNELLNPVERLSYQSAFSNALKIRENQLKAA